MVHVVQYEAVLRASGATAFYRRLGHTAEERVCMDEMVDVRAPAV